MLSLSSTPLPPFVPDCSCCHPRREATGGLCPHRPVSAATHPPASPRKVCCPLLPAPLPFGAGFFLDWGFS